MALFNFRSRVDSGAQYMPDSRERMSRKAGRTIYGNTRLDLASNANSTRIDVIIEQQEDGLAVYEIVAAPKARLKDDLIQGGPGMESSLMGRWSTKGPSRFGRPRRSWRYPPRTTSRPGRRPPFGMPVACR
jgi:hypothetical protein